ncbi:MAG: hypothetical protein E7159_00440 [Firmicutes bacterium]|nr:hypothetical protein [Bacillota bacterium]
MISYKFTIGKKGQLTCYKSDNTLNKYTGSKALNKLEHIKGFNYHSFKNIVKDINTNKKCHSMVFVSNNHMVTFEDINKFQNKADFSIEGILKELLIIIKENQEKNRLIEQNIQKQYNIDARMAKLALMSAFSAAVIAINHYPSLHANTQDKNYISKPVETTVESIVVNQEVDYPNEIVSSVTTGIVSKGEYTVEFDSHNVASFVVNGEYEDNELNSYDGFVEYGPSGAYETYYDADVICDVGMDNCVKYMRDLGYSEEEYPYYIREDGVRMFGDYVMVAADTNILPKGTMIDTSLGMGMVCDHCESSESNPRQIDIAVNWTKKLTLKK